MRIAMLNSRLRSLKNFIVLSILAISIAFGIFVFKQWIGGVLLALLLVSGSLLLTVWNYQINRFLVLFSIVSCVDFLKRVVFLLPDQEGFSQYVVYVLPYLYFALAFLLPAVIRSIQQPVEINPYLLLFIFWMLTNTWIASDTNVVAKLAASVFLLMPWLMVSVARQSSQSFLIVGKTIIFFGILNTLYGLIQFVYGPTIIERNWSQSVADFSIGAQHVQAFLFNWFGGVNFYRPIGLQADAYTFGLFSLNAFVFTWLLGLQRNIQLRYLIPVSAVLLLGVFISTVRSIWVSTFFFIVYAVLASRIRIFSRTWFVLISMGLIFYSANFFANLLFPLIGLASGIQNPFFARVLTFGTLADRVGAWDAFWQDLPNLLFLGTGFAASPWITSKFGGFSNLPLNYGKHNFFNEYLWWGGLLGLILTILILVKAFQKAESEYREGKISLPTLGSFAAYLLSMVLLGQGNGSAFLNLIFFYLIAKMYSPSLQGRC